MQSVVFITSTTRSYKVYFLHTNKLCIFREQFLLLAPMTTYLKDLTQSIGRYGGLSWQYWFKGCLEAQVVSLLGARNFWLAWGGKASSTCLEGQWQYTLTEMSENINHYIVFLVQHQPFSMSYFNECSQLQDMSKIVYLYVKSLFLQYSSMNCSSDQFCVC